MLFFFFFFLDPPGDPGKIYALRCHRCASCCCCSRFGRGILLPMLICKVGVPGSKVGVNIFL